jgi:beta-glucanase (GH16 family)
VLQWPASGEIGIVDHRDTSTSVSHGIQLREYGQHAWRVSKTPLADATLDWHVYKLEWNCDYLRW